MINKVSKRRRFIWLMGGIGNVLFQVNYGMHLQARGYEIRFIVNLTQKNWVTKLLGWTIHPQIYDELISANFVQYNWTPLIQVKLRFFSTKSKFYVHGHLPKEPALHSFGYFQDKKLLQNVLVRLKVPPLTEIQNNPVIHLRLTDSNYAASNKKNVQILQKLMPRCHFTIVTDSPNEAKQFASDFGLKGSIRHGDAISDFTFLQSAKILILADSTFSWWAAALSDVLTEVWIPNRLYKQLGFLKSFQVNRRTESFTQLKRITDCT